MSFSKPLHCFATPYCEVVPNSSEISYFPCLASIRVPELDQQQTRAPVAIMCVVDTSSSMTGEPIETVKKSLRFLISELEETDYLGIVLFSNTVTIPLPLHKMSNEAKKEATAITDGIHANGGTALCAGLLEGLNSLKVFSQDDDTTVISCLLLTDGQANIGIANEADILQEVKKQNLHSIIINTFGYGSSHDVNLLTSLSKNTEGMYYYIEDSELIIQCFGECFGGLVSVYAFDATLTVHLESKNTTLTNLCTTRNYTKCPKTYTFQVSLGNLLAGEEKDIPFEIKINKSNQPEEVQHLARCVVSYFITKDNVKVKCHNAFDLRVTRSSEDRCVNSTPNILVSVHQNREICSFVLEQSKQFSRRGNYNDAKRNIHKGINAIKKSISKDDPRSAQYIRELEKMLPTFENSNTFSFGQYNVSSFSSGVSVQRSNAYASNSCSFGTASSSLMKAKGQAFEQPQKTTNSFTFC